MNHQAPPPPPPPALVAPMDDDLPSYPWAEPSALASAQARRAHRQLVTPYPAGKAVRG
jgi:hypothetical protein